MVQKRRKGRVVSDRMDKTIVVETERIVQNPLYKKYLRRNSRFKAHDEDEAAKPGDYVLIEETRPTSRTKRWRLLEVLEEASVVESEAVTAEETQEDEEDDIE
ncbi:MAG: 30S ribosomal protein S17 [bacterium]